MAARMSDLPPLQQTSFEVEEDVVHEERINALAEANDALVLDNRFEYAVERYEDGDDYARDIIDFTPTIFRNFANRAWLDSVPFPYTTTSVYDRRAEIIGFLSQHPRLRSCRPDLLRQRIVNHFRLMVPRMNSLQVDEDEIHPHTIRGIVSMNYTQEDLDEAVNRE